MKPRELLRLNVLNVQCWTYAKLLTDARGRGDGIAARRLTNKLDDACREFVPLLQRWEAAGKPPLPQLREVEEEPQ